MVNDFLPFCPTDTGTNLLSEADYTASADRTSGNKPGIASSKLNNKAIRQATYIASQIAQLTSNITQTDVLDNATPSQLLAQMMMAFMPLSPVATNHLSGTGNHLLTYYFGTASANATAGATYTNNGSTYTVVTTISAGQLLQMTGPAAPNLSGTLTRLSGTGDATIAFYAYRDAVSMRVRMVGGGAGGQGSGTSPGTPGSGGDTTFGNGTTVLTAGGAAATTPGAASIAGATGIGISGGQPSGNGIALGGGAAGGTSGGSSALGGAGRGGEGAVGGAGATNTGGGGGGAGDNGGNVPGGHGGPSGAYVDVTVVNPFNNYTFGVGAGGTGGTAGTGTGAAAGGAGGSGGIWVVEYFQ